MALIECDNLTKRFGHQTVLDHVNLKLDGGRVVGLAGPNGSGKTTLMKCIERLLQPTEGIVVVDGMFPCKETKSEIAYLPDRDFLPQWMTTHQITRFYADMFYDFDKEKAAFMLADLNIDPSKRYKTLSKGTKEKVRLILTMSRKAKVYLLDEPLAAVDPAARDYIVKTIIGNYNENALVLLSTHLIGDVETVFDEIVILKEGTVLLHEDTDALRERTGMSVDAYFRKVFSNVREAH